MIERLFSGELDHLRGIRRAIVACGQFLVILVEQAKQDKLLIRASGMAYTTLLALVPLVAVLFALFAAFPTFDQLESEIREFLFTQLLPTRQQEIAHYVNQFTANTNKLGVIGFVALVATAILLLDNVERNFNAIWHVTSRRRLVNKITAFTSVLVFGTLFLGASLSISARFETLELSGRILDPDQVAWASSSLLPFATGLLAFLIMYLVIPATRVRLPSALVGAVVAAVLWETGKSLFADSVGLSVRYSTIYGSLAVIPIFLIWLYITWMVILLGLEVAFTHQHFRVLVGSRVARRFLAADRLSLLLAVARTVAERFHRGAPPPTVDDLAGELSLPLSAVEEAACTLATAGFVYSVGDTTSSLVPATSLHRIRVAELVRSVLGGELADRHPWATETTRRFIAAGTAELGDLALLDAVEDPTAAAGRPGVTGLRDGHRPPRGAATLEPVGEQRHRRRQAE